MLWRPQHRAQPTCGRMQAHLLHRDLPRVVLVHRQVHVQWPAPQHHTWALARPAAARVWWVVSAAVEGRQQACPQHHPRPLACLAPCVAQGICAAAQRHASAGWAWNLAGCDPGPTPPAQRLLLLLQAARDKAHLPRAHASDAFLAPASSLNSIKAVPLGLPVALSSTSLHG